MIELGIGWRLLAALVLLAVAINNVRGGDS